MRGSGRRMGERCEVFLNSPLKVPGVGVGVGVSVSVGGGVGVSVVSMSVHMWS